MKSLLFLLIIACLILLNACSKNAISINSNNLTGTWKQVLITGGFAGVNDVPVDDIRISFHADQSYSVTKNDTLTDAGKYSLDKAPEPNYYYSKTIINFSSKNYGNTIEGIQVSNDSLFLSGGCCDQFDYTYKKL